MEDLSVLEFTFEASVDNKLPYLDVLIDSTGECFSTSVYTKTTNTGELLNFDSDAPYKYKAGTITTFLKRADKICNSWQAFHSELQRLRQVFVNNGFPNRLIDDKISKFIDNKVHPDREQSILNTGIILYYENQMHHNYKLEEKAIKSIIKFNVKPKDNEKCVDLRIFYRNQKLSSLVITNNPHCEKEASKQCDLVYQFSCTERECVSLNNRYIGYTRVTLKERFDDHKTRGTIYQHFCTSNGRSPSVDELLASIKILYKGKSCTHMDILEALIIYRERPNLNGNILDFQCLKLFNRTGAQLSGVQ